MKLNYPGRSKFLGPCENAIRKNIEGLLSGKVLTVHLSEQGYDRDTHITVSKSDSKFFQTDWKGSDPTRFSARIRAAALALYNQGCYGTFRVTHFKGLLTIQKTSSNTVLYKKVAKSQYTDGVRINKSFHDLFNPPNSESFLARGESRPITIRFNNKEFTASYLHENPVKVDREMQSIRLSKELMNEFKTVFPDQGGYFSIELGSTINEFNFDVAEHTDQMGTETFAKKYICQQNSNMDDADADKKRRDRLKQYSEGKHASKRVVGTRSVNQSDPILKEDIKQLYRYNCQICSEQIKKVGWIEGLNKQHEFEFLTADAHHVDPLEQNGLDDPKNIICVCPNCHRRLHTVELLIEFGNDGPICRNQITGETLQMNIDPDHSFALRTE
jgi:hypothetical protein